MSMLVALITRRDGLIASDGRRFAPARFESGRRVQDAEPETDAFNKTFALYSGKVVGGVVGLLEFSGMTVAGHVRDILATVSPQPAGLEQIADAVGVGLAHRLKGLSDGEVLLGHRRLDVVFVGGSHLRRSDFRIIALRFAPSTGADGIVWEQENVCHQTPSPCWYLLRGDDAAQAAAQHLLRANDSPSTDRQHLRSFAQRVMEAAIAGAGVHPCGTERSCGGEIFLELTHY